MAAKNTIAGITEKQHKERSNVFTRSGFFAIKNVLFLINLLALVYYPSSTLMILDFRACIDCYWCNTE